MRGEGVILRGSPWPRLVAMWLGARRTDVDCAHSKAPA